MSLEWTPSEASVDDADQTYPTLEMSQCFELVWNDKSDNTRAETRSPFMEMVVFRSGQLIVYALEPIIFTRYKVMSLAEALTIKWPLNAVVWFSIMHLSGACSCTIFYEMSLSLFVAQFGRCRARIEASELRWRLNIQYLKVRNRLDGWNEELLQ